MFRACFGRAFLGRRGPAVYSGSDRFVRQGDAAAPEAAVDDAGPTRTAPASAPAGLNASRIPDMQPEHVTLCDARDIMKGLCLRPRELGRGAYGIVVPGTYRGVSCAVKIMLAPAGLDKTAVRELLLSPRLVHPHVVSTFASRCAYLTHEFFDLLEGERAFVGDPSLPRVLAPVPLLSGDGFGDPKGLADGTDPFVVLHQILHELGADTVRMVVVVVQEFCNLGTLGNAIRKKIFVPSTLWELRLARRALLRTAAEVARGLLHLHDSGVVHGDLKPMNVLLVSSREDRRGFVAKVADFGLAHVLPNAANSLQTDTCGSIPYMAPEAFDGWVSRATDVWSFGVLLWELLTGEQPFAGRRQAEVVGGVRSGSLQLVWPEEAPMAQPIIALGRSCLRRNPKDRPTLNSVIEGLVGIEREIRAALLLRRGDEPSQQQQQERQLATSAPTPAANAPPAESLDPMCMSGIVVL